ncbi:MAG: translocation/assembly module TamB domain-containing protein [Acidobacteriia bacterium]|nr:translocation/assembly module TamB domain-containing protein [Terriglobia bacterium]
MNLKKNLRRILVAVLVLLVTAVIAFFFVVRSRSFHRYVLAKLIEKTAGATGGRVEIGDFAFHWFPLRADIYRLVIHGTEANPAGPLFASDHLGVGLRIISVFESKVDLKELVIDHPVIHLFVDPSGHSNIPRPQGTQEGQAPVNVFDFAIKHFHLQGGELYCNDRQIPLDAELHELEAQARFDRVKAQYNSTLSYRRGRLQLSHLNPLQHDLDARFNASPSGINLDHIKVTTISSRLSAQASVRDYSHPAVEGTYQANISLEELKTILKETSLPVGEVAVNGAARYHYVPGQPFLDGLFLEGHFSSSVLALRMQGVHGEARAARGQYRLEKGNLEATHLEAELLGGRIRGDLRMRRLSGNPESHASGSFSGISLMGLCASLGSKPLEGIPVRGGLEGKAEATWRGALHGLRVRSDAVIAGSAGPASATRSKESTIPLNGELHLDYDDARDILLLTQTRLQTPHTTLLLDGTVSDRSLLNVKASTDDLYELDVLALPVRRTAASTSSPPRLLGVSGTASFTGRMQGTMKEPRFMGQLKAGEFQYQGFSIRALRADFNVSSSQVVFHQGDLETHTQGHIGFDLTAGLRSWSYIPSAPITGQVSLARISIAELESLAKLQYPVTGLLSGDISIRGSLLHPVGQGSVQVVEARLWDQPVHNISLQFQGTGDVVHSTISVGTPAGRATGQITYFPKNQGYEGEIKAPSVRLDQLELVRARHLELKGVLTVSAKGSGTLQSPQLEATMEIPELQIRDQKITGIKAQANMMQERLTLALDSRVAEAYIKVSGTVDLRQGYYTTALLDARDVPLVPFLASYLPIQSRDLRGQAEVHGSLKGPLKDPTRLEAHVEIPTLSIAYQSLQAQNATPIRLDYQNGVVSLQPTKVKGSGIDLQLQATVPLPGPGSINISALGTLDLRLIQIFDPALIGSGEVKLDVAARGDSFHPSIQGGIRVSNGAIQVSNAPLGLERVNGDMRVQNNRLEINHLSGQIGGGSLSARGYVVYRPDVQFHIGLTGNSVRLRYPEGVRAVLGGDLALSGGPNSSELSGQVVVERVSFTKSFDLGTFLNQFSGESPVVSGGGFARNLTLNVSVQTTEELGLESAKLSMQGSANLRVRGTLAEPVVLGRANLTGGELFFLGNRYQIQKGVVDFANRFRTSPVMNLQVTTTVNQYIINLNFVGPVERFRTTYTSDPPLPHVDIINLLVFGKTTATAAATGSTPTFLGAESVLAQGLSSQLSSRVEKFAGISHLSINPLIGGNQRNPGARLAVQQRITKDLLFTFATDVTSTQGEIVQIEYQVSPKWSVTVVRSQTGSIAVDATVRKTF